MALDTRNVDSLAGPAGEHRPAHGAAASLPPVAPAQRLAAVHWPSHGAGASTPPEGPAQHLAGERRPAHGAAGS